MCRVLAGAWHKNGGKYIHYLRSMNTICLHWPGIPRERAPAANKIGLLIQCRGVHKDVILPDLVLVHFEGIGKIDLQA